jgi:S1-C subfamily serine protease
VHGRGCDAAVFGSGIVVPSHYCYLVEFCVTAGPLERERLLRRSITAVAVAIFILASASAAPSRAAQSSEGEAAALPPSIENAVVKVFSTTRPPDLFRPWTKGAVSEVTGSGVVIDGHRILTNAHVVAYASEVQIQSHQGGDRLNAKVAFVSPGIDLAVLTLDDDSFFKGRAPIARSGGLPTTKDAVLVYGYPTGGQTLSVTKGIVSRIEFTFYNFPTSGLRVQIDAAINPGNSGGPAVVGDKMIGLAFSKLGGAENIGYIIPVEEIELFLDRIRTGRTGDKPALFESFQTLENPALRTFLKLPEDARGIVLQSSIFRDRSSPLRQWDLVTGIARTPIDDQGEIQIAPNVRVKFLYLVQKVASNGVIPLSIVRDGKPLEVKVPVAPEHLTLIQGLHGTYPPYFIYGPLVFSIATQELVSAIMGRTDTTATLVFTRSPLVTERFVPPSTEREELVVIASPFLPHRLSKGYANHVGSVLEAVNGRPIRGLSHLVTTLRDLEGELVRFEFSGTGIESMVFPRKEMLATTESLLADNGIRTQASPELLKLWNDKAAH